MSSNLYDSLPQGLREVLDNVGLSEVARQMYADLAEQQAKVYSGKEKAKEAVEQFKSEFQRQSKKKQNYE